jgi:dihydrofolate synthase/folylpolyglutamate synthase
MNLLPENSEFYFAKPSINRGRHPEDYENFLRKQNFYKIFNSVDEGISSAKERCTRKK